MKNSLKRFLALSSLLMLMTILPLGFWGNLYPRLTLVEGTYSVIEKPDGWDDLTDEEKQDKVLSAKGSDIKISSALLKFLRQGLRSFS